MGACVAEGKQKSKWSILLLPKPWGCSDVQPRFAAVRADAHCTRGKPGVNTLKVPSVRWPRRETQRPRTGGRRSTAGQARRLAWEFAAFIYGKAEDIAITS